MYKLLVLYLNTHNLILLSYLLKEVESAFGGTCCVMLLQNLEGKRGPQQWRQTAGRQQLPVTVQGGSMTSSDSPGETPGQAGKTHSPVVVWLERAEGHKGLFDCCLTKAELPQKAFLGQLQLVPQPGLDPELSSWEACWPQGRVRELDAI